MLHDPRTYKNVDIYTCIYVHLDRGLWQIADLSMRKAGFLLQNQEIKVAELYLPAKSHNGSGQALITDGLVPPFPPTIFF